MKNYIIAFCFIILIAVLACEEDKHKPITKDKQIPSAVLNPKVKNLPGGALITYDLPDEDDLLYVEAKYQLKNGTNLKVKASVFGDTLEVTGFGDTDVYNVDLYTIDRSENRSEPVQVQVQPETPQVINVFESLTLAPTFGGVNVKWENDLKDPMAIKILIPDTLNNNEGFIDLETIYTEASKGDYNIRGFKIEEIPVYGVVRDRWNNYSDTIKVDILPLYEEEIDKSKFKEVILPNDTKQVEPWNANGFSTIPKLWDGNSDSRLVGFNGEMPEYYYTFDMGTVAKLSRFKFWQFTQSSGKYLYFDAQYRKFKIYGAETLDASGDIGSWTLLKECEIVKPSGLPDGLKNYTNEDKQIALEGHDFEIPLEAPAVRYIRVQVVETASGLNWASCGEMTFWGQPIAN
ncbi:DUF4959 domain-containing protein [Prolixibacteraceae bacterium JC049]|nr:DUF4959 domain-containing protein [Prolixibacteraceae bacterium JC049]